MSFILDALKKVDRKSDVAEEGIVMQGGRVWGESRWAGSWGWGAILVLAIVTFGLASVALFRSFQLETREAAAGASEPQPVESSPGETPASISNGTDDAGSPDKADKRRLAPKKSSREVLTVEASSTGVIEPGTLPEAGLVEADVLAELVPPVKLVGRGATERSSPPNPEAEQEKPPVDLRPLALQGTSVIDGKPVAVVNYQRVFEGDIIEGARVIKILDRAVELEFQGNRFTIRL